MLLQIIMRIFGLFVPNGLLKYTPFDLYLYYRKSYGSVNLIKSCDYSILCIKRMNFASIREIYIDLDTHTAYYRVEFYSM